jgi:hypothetical protein
MKITIQAELDAEKDANRTNQECVLLEVQVLEACSRRGGVRPSEVEHNW